MMRKNVLRGLLVALFWLLLWYLLARLVGKELLLPSPSAVCRRLLSLAGEASFWRTCGVSLLRILSGVLTAVLAGTVLAVLTSRFSLLRALFSPLLTVIKSTPVASFIILALVWMGRSILPAFIASLIVLPVVWSNVSAGIAAADPQLLEVAALFRFSRGKTALRVYLPAATPYFLSACRSSLGLGWKAGIAAEVLTMPAVSIGKMLYESKLYLETVDLFTWTVVVVLCSLLIEKLLLRLLSALETRLHKGVSA